MSILSWLFPSDEDRLRKARRLMSKGRYEDARRGLVHCKSPEAEALYDECSAAVDKEGAAAQTKQARASGFRGWRVEVTMKDARGKAQLEALILKELASAKVSLEALEVDQDAVQAAFGRAERKARNKGIAGAATLKLVPVMASGRVAL
jgi:hypothetical protein